VAGESAREAARRQREKAERLLRSAELYERGAEGEQQTAAVLSRLPTDQWTVFHDRRWPGRKLANVDHVVVGPPGVFVIDSKNWVGRVCVKDGVLRQNGYRRESTVRAAADAATAVAQLSQAVQPAAFHPVLCFVRDDAFAGWAEEVLVCSANNLVQMLTSQPPVLSAEQVRSASLELDGELGFASDPLAAARPRPAAPEPPTETAPDEGPAAPSPIRVPQVAWGLVMCLALLTAVLVGLTAR
jgi:hypothetical protein